mmetsp:Transcript_37252/g.33433  ORF Transcript_37252/g.33433 Transcript_37252/m.33433 type:complete len:88 (-) Transcript_37252:34-297(-)
MSKSLDPGKKRKEVIDEILNKTLGVMKKICHRHDGCRIIQGCLKYGDQDQRNQILELFVHPKEMIELAKSKYGHFLAMKIAKYLTKV